MKATSSQKIAINIIKWSLFGAVIGLLLFMLTKKSGAENSADFDTLKANVTQAAKSDNMQEGDKRMLKRLYGIDPESLEGFVLYYPSSNMGAEELLLIRAKEKSDAEGLRSLIEQRNASQINAFEGYGVEQTQSLKEAVINEYGRDILYVVGAGKDAAVSAYEGSE